MSTTKAIIERWRCNMNTTILIYSMEIVKKYISKNTQPCSRLVSIFWTINHFSDTGALFTPALDSPVMHCTLPCTVPVHYGREGDTQPFSAHCTMGNQAQILSQKHAWCHALWVILCCLVQNMWMRILVACGVYANVNTVSKWHQNEQV